MSDFAVTLALVLVLLTACLAGLVYLAWPALQCVAAFTAATCSALWQTWQGRQRPRRRRTAPCGHECPYCYPAPAWARDLELTR